MVAHGLKLMRKNKSKAGILAILNQSGRQLSTLTSGDLSFAIAPRLNAAGRLTDMSLGIECLLTDDKENATEMAKKLNQLNIERRQIQDNMEEQAFTEFEKYLQSVAIDPVIKFLQAKAKECANLALSNAVKKKYIPAEVADDVEKVLHNAFKRFLHHPNITLRKMADSAEVDILVSSIKRLFGMNGESLDMNKCEYHMEKGIFK